MSYVISLVAGALAMWIVVTDVYPGVACHPDPAAYFNTWR